MYQSCIIVRFMYDIKQNSFIHVKLECFESSSGRWFIFKKSGLQSSLQNRMRTFIVHYYIQIVFIYVFSNGRRMEYTFTKQKIWIWLSFEKHDWRDCPEMAALRRRWRHNSVSGVASRSEAVPLSRVVIKGG